MDISRGEVWFAHLGETRGREQSGSRPVLVISDSDFNVSGAGLAVVVPLTTRGRGVRTHLAVEPPEGGLKHSSFIMCEQVRSVDLTRFARRFGRVSEATLAETEMLLAAILGL